MRKLALQILVIIMGCAALHNAALADDPVLDKIIRQEIDRDRAKRENDARSARLLGERLEKEQKERDEKIRAYEAQEKREQEEARRKEQERLQADPEWQAKQRKDAEEYQQRLQQANRDFEAAEELRRENERRDQELRLHSDPDNVGARAALALNRDDYKAALEAWNFGAMCNYTFAQFELGRAYATGRIWRASKPVDGGSVPVNMDAAAPLLRKAAEGGHPDAQAYFGDALAQGAGVPQNFESALYWYRKAADSRIARAFIGLGRLYEQGHGVPKDTARANLLFIRAVLCPEVSLRLACTTEKELIGRMTHSEIAAAFASLGADIEKNKLRFNLQGKSAYYEDLLGRESAYYKNLHGESAYEWYALAADLAGGPQYDAVRNKAGQKLTGEEFAHAQINLAMGWMGGRFREIHIGVNQDFALKYLLAAMRQGSGAAQYLLGAIFEKPVAELQKVDLHVSEKINENRISAYVWYAIAAIQQGWAEGTPDWPKTWGFLISGEKEGPHLMQVDMIPPNDFYGVAETRNRLGKILPKVELARAQFIVGRFFELELSAWQDKIYSMMFSGNYSWYGMSLNNGNKDAMYQLSVAYAKGVGVKKDANAASYYYQLAVKNGSTEAEPRSN